MKVYSDLNKLAITNEAKCSGYVSIGLCFFTGNLFGFICAIKIVRNVDRITVEYLNYYGTLKCWYLLAILYFIAVFVGGLYIVYSMLSDRDYSNAFSYTSFGANALAGFLCLQSSFNSFTKLWWHL
eukprot:TRINITY_DN2101_c0_g2_i2.p1 TRINITY_DN2101_c0_g2~~TRINITY_DN2101_c0_g2_i2.p1  ORF type:complete len:126 (+),score=1.57 TRINITY_DN2101_c0_g2_i2:91-468(+)